jgi:hypothetical protein
VVLQVHEHAPLSSLDPRLTFVSPSSCSPSSRLLSVDPGPNRFSKANLATGALKTALKSALESAQKEKNLVRTGKQRSYGWQLVFGFFVADRLQPTG